MSHYMVLIYLDQITSACRADNAGDLTYDSHCEEVHNLNFWGFTLEEPNRRKKLYQEWYKMREKEKPVSSYRRRVWFRSNRLHRFRFSIFRRLRIGRCTRQKWEVCQPSGLFPAP